MPFIIMHKLGITIVYNQLHVPNNHCYIHHLLFSHRIYLKQCKTLRFLSLD